MVLLSNLVNGVLGAVGTSVADAKCKLLKNCPATTTKAPAPTAPPKVVTTAKPTTTAPAAGTVAGGKPVVVTPSTTLATVARTTSSSSSSSTLISITMTSSSSSSSSSASSSSSSSSSAAPSASAIVDGLDSTVLVLAKDAYGATAGTSGLLAYGVPFEILIVPQGGVDLPTLNSTATRGNYGGIILIDALSYQYPDGGWRSAITADQFTALYNYQLAFNVRMVRINEFPGPQFGATVAGAGGTGEDQPISFTDTSDFATANLKTNAGVSTAGLWHYPATITNTTSTKQVAKFGTSASYSSDSVAAVINNFEGRQQFVWFVSWASDWSSTSALLQHAHVHWMTRGVFLGKRKTYLGAQVDDIQLDTELYYPANTTFKIRTGDLDAHIDWQKDLLTRLPSGSDFRLELAHNGNGDLLAATAGDGSDGACNPDTAVFYDMPPATPLEFQKPLGTGEDAWPADMKTFPWNSDKCLLRDDFAAWFRNKDKLNAFAHLSHTFSHLGMNNATYHDVDREIAFNKAWMKAMGIDQAAHFSGAGLVPPAITGMHNGDALRAWSDNGIKNVVGDNTRPVLRNSQSKYYSLRSNTASNGFDGMVIMPRYATTIYYNCDTPDCTSKEWKDTSAGTGVFSELLDQARRVNTQYLFNLQADPYMFHQANMRQIDMPESTVGSKTGKMSLVMSWVETVTQEMGRLTDWPILTLKHDDLAQYFLDKETLDNCQPRLSYGFSDDKKTITSVTVGAGQGNSCSVPIPVTIPSGSVSGGSVSVDQVGSEPPIQWVKLSGSPVTLSLGEAVKV